MIVLSLPYLSGNFLSNYTKNIGDRYDYIEYRLDMHKDPFSLPEELINERTILTYRGENIPRLVLWMRKQTLQYRCLADIDIVQYERMVTPIPPTQLILSHHCDKPDWTVESIREIVQLSNEIPSKILKLALRVERYEQLLQFPEIVTMSRKPVLIVGTGKLGFLTRVLYSSLDSIGTYVGLDGYLTADGQLSHTQAERYRIRNNRLIPGGIIGGDQVMHSLGLLYYNDYFQQNDIEAVYLPFPVADLQDFFAWMDGCGLKFYGFSVTMPFKSQFAPEGLPAGNTVIYGKSGKRTLCSDLTSFHRSIEFLELGTDEHIAVYGTGATAELALIALKDFKKVTVVGRNEAKAQKLAEQFGRSHALDFPEADALINCTPVIFFPPIPASIRKVIDLPYTISATSLIRYAKREEIAYVTGVQFWEWQAEEQREVFTKSIEEIRG